MVKAVAVSERERQLWEQGWEGHTRAQRARFAELTPAQKLDWLEEAHRFVLRVQEARRRSAEDDRSSESTRE